jgi:hypothetical protein
MANNIEPINFEKHAQLKMKPGVDLARFENEHILPVTVHEVTRLAADFPIAFAKAPDTGQFQTFAMVGFKQGENYMIHNGEWHGQVPPGIVMTNPFVLVRNPHNEEQMFIAADVDSPLFDDKEGQPLFNEDGSETDFFVERKENVRAYFEHAQVTMMFGQALADLDLLQPQNLTIEVGTEKLGVESVYVVSEEKLDALSDEQFLDLKKRGFLPVIYAHLASFNQVRRLAKMRLQQQPAQG